MAEISQDTCIVEKTELTCGHYARCPDKSSSISSVVPWIYTLCSRGNVSKLNYNCTYTFINIKLSLISSFEYLFKFFSEIKSVYIALYFTDVKLSISLFFFLSYILYFFILYSLLFTTKIAIFSIHEHIKI